MIPKHLFVFSTALCLIACQTTSSTDYSDPNRAFDKDTGQLVMQAQYLAESSNYHEALGKLEMARMMPDLNAYEASKLESIMGAYRYEIDEIDSSVAHYRNAIQAGGLLSAEVKSLEKDIGLIYYEEGNYKAAANLWSDWIERYGETPTMLKHVMQAYVQDNNYTAAYSYADKWFATGEAGEERPADLMTWLQIELKNRNLAQSFPQMISCY